MDPNYLKVLMNTIVVKPPKQGVYTFGTTTLTYNLVTQPLYQALDINNTKHEAVVRTGTVKAEPPKIVTPNFLSRSVGFGDQAQNFLEELIKRGQANTPGILYTYHNQPSKTEIVYSSPDLVAERISKEIDVNSKSLETVILGVDELWDVSLMKFILDWTNQSAPDNTEQFKSSGRLGMLKGIPQDARIRIEEMFHNVKKGDLDPTILHDELENWDVFDEYQDNFFSIFKGRRSKKFY